MFDTSAPALLVTQDERLVVEVARLAAAVAVEVVVERHPEEALRSWAAASAVLVGFDAAGRCAASAPPRRTGVRLVGLTLDDGVFRDAVACGAEAVIRLPDEDEELVRVLADLGEDARGNRAVIGVIGGAGGVGASTFATALGLLCAELVPTVLVDADPGGAGLDQILGLEKAASGVRWDALADATGRLSGRSLREALPRRHGLSVLAWPVERGPVPDVAAVREVVAAATRGFGVVVLDLPRYAGPWTTDLLSRCDRVVLVTTTTVPAVAASTRILAGLHGLDVTLVLRRSGGGIAESDVGRFLGLRVVASMSRQRGLDEDVALGLGPARRRRGPLARAAAAVTTDCLQRIGTTTR